MAHTDSLNLDDLLQYYCWKLDCTRPPPLPLSALTEAADTQEKSLAPSEHWYDVVGLDEFECDLVYCMYIVAIFCDLSAHTAFLTQAMRCGRSCTTSCNARQCFILF